jgi:xylulokinase
MLLPKDFVRFRLTGNLATDVADASGTCLLDVRQRAWSDEVVDALDVPRDWLPRVCESPEVCARVSADGARQTGLLEGTPVVAGAGDQAAEAVGCGVVDDGQVAVTIGTSGVVFAATQQMRIDPDGGLHAYCHAAPDRWHVMGVMLSAGGSLQWYRETFCPDESLQAATHGGDAYERLINEASRVRPGCEGLTFLPYLTGERTPHADPYARGVFFGLTRRHEKAHLTRAVLEGVTFGLRDALELARSAGITPAFIRVSGGGTRSDLWRRMLADVFDHEIATVNATQGAAYGAALLAGVGAGTHASVGDACRCTVQETGTTCPTNPAAYRAAYRRYRSLYPALAPIFRSLAADS